MNSCDLLDNLDFCRRERQHRETKFQKKRKEKNRDELFLQNFDHQKNEKKVFVYKREEKHRNRGKKERRN